MTLRKAVVRRNRGAFAAVQRSQRPWKGTQVRHLIAAAAAVVVALSACGGSTASDDPQQTQAGPTPEWGPLAVVPPPEGQDEALIHGTLHVTDECVLLEEQGDDVLLVWPADRATWNPNARTVTFENPKGGTVTIEGGDELRIGGGGSSADEGGVSNEEYVSRRDWVSPPEPSCVTDTRWGVGTVQAVSNQQP